MDWRIILISFAISAIFSYTTAYLLTKRKYRRAKELESESRGDRATHTTGNDPVN